MKFILPAFFILSALAIPPAQAQGGHAASGAVVDHVHACADHDHDDDHCFMNSHHDESSVDREDSDHSDNFTHTHTHRHSPDEPEHSHSHEHTSGHVHSGPYVALNSLVLTFYAEGILVFHSNLAGAPKEPSKNSLFRPPIS